MNRYRSRRATMPAPALLQPTQWTQSLAVGLVCWSIFGLIPFLLQSINAVTGISVGGWITPWSALVLWACLLRAACGLNLVLLPSKSSLWMVAPHCFLQAALFSVGFALGLFGGRGSLMSDWLGVAAPAQTYLAQWCLIEVAAALSMACVALSARLVPDQPAAEQFT